VSKKSKRRPERSERRAQQRRDESAIADRWRLAALEEGGAPSKPIEVESASVIEVTAAAMPCVACGGRVRVDEHAARTVDDVPLRIVRVACSMCGRSRVLHFRVVVRAPN
jgi:hypothetical protein